MNLKTKWMLLGLFVALPYLALGVAGAWWIYSSGLTLWWLTGLAIVSLISWPLTRWLRGQAPAPMPVSAGPSESWSPVARGAWSEVETIAKRASSDVQVYEHPELLLALGNEVIESVARKFHPRVKNPVLEIPVPHLLRIVELVASDLRTLCSDNIPGSHILTINDFQKLKRLFRLAPTLSRIYRLGSLIFNPAGALMRELNAYVVDQLLSASADETKRWLFQYAIRRFGFYAIELYSGHLILRDVEFDTYTTGSGRRAVEVEQQRTARLENEPLRILVIGQVKAGKSSLVNALFGETKAAVDVVPRTAGVDPYLIERDGLRRAIVLDTAGYEEVAPTEAALQSVREEIERCDLVILVCSAGLAARDADRRLLNEVRAVFQRRPDREFPPLVVAITHIDQLRPFREWNPPYNLTNPQCQKALQIRDATEAVAQDLAVDIGQVIPVCLKEGLIYNVDDGLIPAILQVLSAARRLQYLRCLREFNDEQYWQKLRQQAVNAGRVLLRTGREMVGDLLGLGIEQGAAAKTDSPPDKKKIGGPAGG